MEPIRKTSLFVGLLILIAYSMLFAEITDSKIITFLVDVISGASVMGIAYLMFKLFSQFNKALSLTYIAIKAVEGLLIIAAGVLFLNESTQSLRATIYGGIHTYIFIVGAFLFYYLLLKTRFVPRLLSIWGIVAIGSLLLITVLGLFNINNPELEYLLILIITNEVVLAFWLMFKGFNTQTLINI